jgi:transcriptional regulator with XRE-family HTH domain
VYVGHYELELESIPVIEFRIEEPETLGEYIRKLRMLNGWSQKELANRIVARPETIVNWEKGQHTPQRKTIPKLIGTLDADPWEAIRFDGVITERQRRILTHFSGKAAFTFGECMELFCVGEVHKDLGYLVDIEILDRQVKGDTEYYRTRIHRQPKTLGELIRRYRIESKHTAKELGSIIGVTEDTILNWEKNRTHPSQERLILLRVKLDIDPGKIIKFGGAISQRQKDILDLIKKQGSVTRRECQRFLNLQQKDAQNGLLFLYRLGILGRTLGKRHKATYFMPGGNQY